MVDNVSNAHINIKSRLFIYKSSGETEQIFICTTELVLTLKDQSPWLIASSWL